MIGGETDALKLENQICFPLYACSRAVIKQYHPCLDQIGLTYTQYVTMMVLWDERQISVRDLGKRLYLDSGTLTPVLKSMESKGYVTRQRSEQDERLLIISLTDAGEALRGNAAVIPEQVGCRLGLSAEDAVKLYKLLYQVLGTLDAS
ncbi:MAG: MarR family transcriptional regulator [Oscillospiraceae bacterium]|nr:MarR family transcriptional regulator [Oscillospiraceae bacterium]